MYGQNEDKKTVQKFIQLNVNFLEYLTVKNWKMLIFQEAKYIFRALTVLKAESINFQNYELFKELSVLTFKSANFLNQTNQFKVNKKKFNYLTV